jgi:hypothetical protein
LVAVFVLLLNDHLFKQVWPGFVTGKLSDVAGLVVAPPLVALVLARRADLGGVLGTGVLFVLVKATDAGAEGASRCGVWWPGRRGSWPIPRICSRCPRSDWPGELA